MARWLTIAAVILSAGLFAWGVPLLRLFGALQPLITAISIMVAAVFVRLNRGMPTLEWKSTAPEDRKRLTAHMVAITKEYGWIISINAATLIGLVALSTVGKDDVLSFWPAWAQRLASGAIGAGCALCIARMAYVIWRDIDVVTLQKRLIDGTATREQVESEARSADDKVALIRSAGVRKVGIAAPQTWGD